MDTIALGLDSCFLPGTAIAVVNHPQAILTITDTGFFDNGIGIRAAAFKLRNSNLIGNQIDLALRGDGADLGTTNSPGGNVIGLNSSAGLMFDNQVLSVIVFARGNTWNANEQGADAQGHYLPGTVVNGNSSNANGKNFKLPATGAKIQF